MPFKINAVDSHGLQSGDNCVSRVCAFIADNASDLLKEIYFAQPIQTADDEY